MLGTGFYPVWGGEGLRHERGHGLRGGQGERMENGCLTHMMRDCARAFDLEGCPWLVGDVHVSGYAARCGALWLP